MAKRTKNQTGLNSFKEPERSVLPPATRAVVIDEVATGEMKMKQVDYEDDASNDHPSPKKNAVFTSKWNQFIGNVIGRKNFKIGHLEQLVILCDMYVEYETLSERLRETGYTYDSMGTHGYVVKPYPEVQQLNRVRSEIRNYSKILGLILVKDESTKGSDEATWD